MDNRKGSEAPSRPDGTGRAPLALSRLALLAGGLVVPLLLSRQGRDLKLTATATLAAAALALATFRGETSRAAHPYRTALSVLVGAWLASLLASMVLAQSPYPSAPAEIWRQLCFMTIFLLSFLSMSGGDSARLRAILLFSFIPVGIYAVMQRAGIEPVADFRGWNSSDRVFATFGNPDFLGAYAAMLLPLFLGAGAASRMPWRTAWLVASGLVSLTLYWTFSRGAWLGAAAGLAVWALLSFPRDTLKRHLPRLAAVAALTLAVASVAGLVPWNQFTRRTDRLLLWEGAARMVREHPLSGWGLGSFPSEYPRFAPAEFAARMKADNTFAEHPHCEYLHIAVEGGVVGLGVFIWLLAFIARSGIAKARSGSLFAPSLLGALSAILVHMAVDRNFRLASTGFPFWLLAGALLAQGVVRPTAPPSPSRLSQWIRLAISTAVPLLLLAALVSQAYRPLLAAYRVAGDRDFLAQPADVPLETLEAQRATRSGDPVFFVQLGNAHAKRNDFPRAVEAFSRALEMDPRNSSAANNLGNSYFMMSRFDNAIAAYEKALALNPAHADARFNMAYAYFHKRDIKRALAECEILLKQDPSYYKALQLKSQIAP